MELYIAWYGKCINQCLMKEAELLVLTEKKRFIIGFWTYVIVRFLFMYQEMGPKEGRAWN